MYNSVPHVGKWQSACLRVSIAMKRDHDQGNSYKGKHLIGLGLQVQRISPYVQHADRYSAGEVAKEFYICIVRQQEERDTGLGLSI